MSSSIVGVDIGATSIRAVEVSRSGKSKPVLLGYYEVPIPEGAVVSGEVMETNTVVVALKQLWSAGKFRSKDVVLGVGSPKVLVRDLTVPRLNPKELKSSLPGHVQDMLPVPIADALLDFYPTSETATENGPMVNGLLVAAVKQSVLANVTALQRAGLSPVSVDLIPFALTRLHSQPGNVAFIDVGERTTNVVIASNGVPQFVRIIATGGNDLTLALASQLEVSHPDAVRVKHGLGLGTANVPQEHLPTVQIIREVTSELLSSLRNTLAYYANIHQNEVYSGLVLSGGGAKLNGFHLALGEITRIPITIIDPFERVVSGKKIDSLPMADRQSYGVALALAIGYAA